MHGVTVLLAAAAAAFALARLLRVPPIPLLLLAGFAVARVAPVPPELLEDALILGVSMLLFLGGMELDPRRVRGHRRAAFQVGAVQFAVLAALGYAAARGLGLGPVEAGYLAIALSASSTLVGVRLLQRRERMFEPFGRLVLGVLLLQDALVLLTIPLVTQLDGGWAGAVAELGAVALLGGAAVAVRNRSAGLLLRVSADAELLLLSTLLVLFAFLGAGALLGLPVIVGAFLAGVALARFPINGIVRIELAPVADFFNALFFTALGALVRIPDGGETVSILVLTAVVVLTTVPVVTAVGERAGLSARSGVEAGLLLSQTSEISLVIGLMGMLAGVIGEDVFTVIAWVTLATMLMTPLLATDRMARRILTLHPSTRRAPPPTALNGHVLLLGAGSTGMPLLEDLIIAGAPVLVVDDDPGVLARLAEAGIATVRGDASDPEVLRRAGAHRAGVVCSTLRRAGDNRGVLELADRVPVLVRVFDRNDDAWVRRHGGIPILYSEATADALMAWVDDQEDLLEADWRARLDARATPA